MHDSGQDRIFNEWLASHKGILFKVVHAYAFEHAELKDVDRSVALLLLDGFCDTGLLRRGRTQLPGRADQRQALRRGMA
jgi:hypothetical protein